MDRAEPHTSRASLGHGLCRPGQRQLPWVMRASCMSIGLSDEPNHLTRGHLPPTRSLNATAGVLDASQGSGLRAATLPASAYAQQDGEFYRVIQGGQHDWKPGLSNPQERALHNRWRELDMSKYRCAEGKDLKRASEIGAVVGRING